MTDQLIASDALFDEQAEEAVLSGVLIDPGQYDNAAMHIESVDAFNMLRHQHVWDAMTRLKMENVPIDLVPLAEKLEAMGVLDLIGGRAYLVKILNSLGTSVNTRVYAEMVARFHDRRKIVMASDRIRKLAYDREMTIHDIKSQSEEALIKSTQRLDGYRFGGWAHEIMSERYELFERMLVQGDSVPGVPTGIHSLDDVFLGFEPGQLSIWAGRPGMGKSSTFTSVAYNRCVAGDTVIFFSSEMSRDKVMDRIWSIEAKVPVKKLKLPRKLSEVERARVTDAFGVVSEFKIFIDDTPNPTPRYIRTMTRLYKQRFDIAYILVDGIYTMAPTVDTGSKVNNVGSISSDLREIARYFDIHVATTHQLNRSVENRQDKRPMLSDLRDSGQLEQDADKVIFLYRDDVYNEASDRPNQIDLIVAKHRDGPTGVASAYFQKELMRVCNASVHRVDLSDLE